MQRINSIVLMLIAAALWIQVVQHYQTPVTAFAQSAPARTPPSVTISNTPIDVRIIEDRSRLLLPAIQDVRVVKDIIGQPTEVKIVNDLPNPLRVTLVGPDGLIPIPPVVPRSSPSPNSPPRWEYVVATCGLDNINRFGSQGWELLLVLDNPPRATEFSSKCTAFLKRPIP